MTFQPEVTMWVICVRQGLKRTGTWFMLQHTLASTRSRAIGLYARDGGGDRYPKLRRQGVARAVRATVTAWSLP